MQSSSDIAFDARVNALCQEFETDLKAAKSPRIEDFLERVDEGTRRHALKALLAVELRYHRSAVDQKLAQAAYEARFPQDMAAVREVFLTAWDASTRNSTSQHESTRTIEDAQLRAAKETALIGKYRVIQALGEGGQGTTYLVHDSELDRQVVLKRYHADEAPERHLRQEGRSLAHVNSPYVAKCYTLEHIDGQFYLVMEYVRGEPLDDYVRRNSLDFPVIARLVARVAEGLRDVHDAGLLHRDIKPANILVRRNGTPCLVDFGLAAPLGSQSLDQFGGTFQYMSPEQANSDQESLGPRSDVFGLGAVLYSLLCGTPPYSGRRADVWEQAKHANFLAPRARNSNIPEALEAICLKAMSRDIVTRYRSADSFAEDLRRWAGHDDPTSAVPDASSTPKSVPREPLPLEPNPFRGLAAFTEDDEDWYFGRERQIERMWNVCSLQYAKSTSGEPIARILPILGPSGSGKSSLARAGLLARLRRQPFEGLQKLQTLVITPGPRPLESLATALARLATSDPSPVAKAREFEQEFRVRSKQGKHDGLRRIIDLVSDISSAPLVLLVDQFEELYTLCDDPNERTTFIEILLEAARDPSGRLSVLLTMRTDFVGATQDHRVLNQWIAAAGLLVPVMSDEELRSAITEPAAKSHYPLDPAIVDLLVAQSREREGALPLLQFALTRIWEGLSQGVTASQTLKKLGGVGGALAGEAQRIFDSLDKSQRIIARRVMLGLVQLGEGARDTRRRALVASLVSHEENEQHVRAVLARFSGPGARLITLSSDERGQETVEITHEALLDHWDLLNEWLDESREAIRLHRRLAEAAFHWQETDRAEGLLWRSPDLDLLNEFVARSKADLTKDEWDFFESSNAAQRDDARRAKRRVRLYQGAALVFAIMCCMVVGLALWANEARKTAESERMKAGQEAKRADGEATKARSAASAAENAATRADERLKESQRAWFRLQLGNARDLLERKPLQAVKLLDNEEICPAPLRGFIWGLYRQWCDREIRTLRGHREFVWAVAYSPDGDVLATGAGGMDGKIKLWDPKSGALLKSLEGHNEGVWSLSFSPDGSTLASAGADGLKRWNVASGDRIDRLSEGISVHAVAYSPDGRTLASADQRGTIHLWNTETGQLTRVLKEHRNIVRCLRFSADSRLLASGGDDRLVCLWNVSDGRVRWKQEPRGRASSVAFVPGTEPSLACAIEASVEIRGVEKGEVLTTLSGHENWIYSLAVSSDGGQLVTASFDRSVRAWDLKNRQELSTLGEHDGYALGIDISPDGSQIASGGSDEMVILWRTGAASTPGRQGGLASPPLYSPAQDQSIAIDIQGRSVVLSPDEAKAHSPVCLNMRSKNRQVYSGRGNYLAQLAGTSELVRWPATDTDGAEPSKLKLEANLSQYDWLEVSRDGGRLVGLNEGGRLEVWNLSDGQNWWHDTVARSPGRISNACLADNGSVLAALSSTGELLAIELERKQRISVVSNSSVTFALGTGLRLSQWCDEHQLCHCSAQHLASIALSPDGSFLAAADARGFVLCWKREEAGYEFLRSVTQVAGSPGMIRFSSDGQWLAVVSRRGSAVVIDMATMSPHSLSGAHAASEVIAFNRDNTALLSFRLDGSARRWDLEWGTAADAKPLAKRRELVGLRTTPDASRVLGIYDDLAVSVFDVESGAEIAYRPAPPGMPFQIQQNSDGGPIVFVWHPQIRLQNTDGSEPALVLTDGQRAQLEICFSPAEDRIATRTDDEVQVWDIATAQIVQRFSGRPISPQPLALSFSEDWRLLALVDTKDEKRVHLYDVASGSKRGTITTDHDAWSLAIQANGAQLAIAESESSEVRVWDTPNLEKEPRTLKHRATVYSVRFLADDSTLAATTTGGEVVLWNTASWQERLAEELQGAENVVRYHLELNRDVQLPSTGRLLFSRNGRTMIIQVDETRVRAWDVATGRLRSALNEAGPAVQQIAIGRERLVLLHEPSGASLWNFQDGQSLAELESSDSRQEGAAFAPDDSVLATIERRGQSSEIVLWDPQTGNAWERMPLSTIATRVGFSSDGGQLYALQSNDEMLTWSTQFGDLHERPRNELQVIAVSAQRMALADQEGKIYVLPTNGTGTVVAIEGHNVPVRGLAFSPQGEYLASTSDDETCKLWDMESGQLLHSFTGLGARAVGVEFSPDGQYLAATTFRNVRVWSVASREEVWNLPHASFVFDVTFTSDSKRLVTCQSVPDVRLWSPDDGESGEPSVAALKGHNSGALCVATTNDGKLAASGGADGRICLWSTESTELVKVLNGHTDWVHSVAFSRDGRLLASGGADGALRVWDVGSGETMYHEKGEQPVWSLCWSADGSLVGAGLDGTARRWSVTSDTSGVRLQSTEQWTVMGLQSQLPTVDTANSSGTLSLAVEEEALRLVSKLLQTTDVIDEVVAAIRRKPELTEEVRSRAILLAKRQPAKQQPAMRQFVDPQHLNQMAWTLVRRAGQPAADYERGLGLITEAVRLRPGDTVLLNTLGVAQYRNRKWKQAIATFKESIAIGEQLPNGPYPHDLAFLAMSHAQLGDLELADLMLARANEGAKSPRWSDNEELHQFLLEARQAIDERKKQ